MNEIEQLVSFFMKFPGVGRRQARRFAYFMVNLPPSELTTFMDHMNKASSHAKRCDQCMKMFSDRDGGASICEICRDPQVDHTRIMVVEKDVDVENVQRSRVYTGRYFVLGGAIPVVSKKEIESVRMKEFFDEVKRAIKEDGLNEIIIALSVNPDGDHTTDFLKSKIEALAEVGNVTITTLGRGLSTGAELEYMDPDTIESALTGRK